MSEIDAPCVAIGLGGATLSEIDAPRAAIGLGGATWSEIDAPRVSIGLGGAALSEIDAPRVAIGLGGAPCVCYKGTFVPLLSLFGIDRWTITERKFRYVCSFP